MSEQTKESISADAKPKKKWRWWQTVLVIIFGGYFLVKLLASVGSNDLELTRRDAILRDDGKTLDIVNVGKGPITITDVTINDRSECTLANSPAEKFKPVTLKVGDMREFFSTCRIIRAQVQSDQGSNVYSFNR